MLRSRHRTELAAVLLSALLMMGCGGNRTSPGAPAGAPAALPGPRVVLPDGSSVTVEIVADQETRARGLMYRPSLPPDRGMLFLFPEAGPHGFWMKETLIPLDIVWIDASRRIFHVEENVPPCEADPCPTYGPAAGEALYVLELAAGQAAEHAVRPGAEIQLPDLSQYRPR